MSDEALWNKILNDIKKYNDNFKDNIIMIGGVAATLHFQKLKHEYKDYTHDADLYISRADFTELREYETIINNPRLSKFEIIKPEYSIDIYVEYNSKLTISFDEIAKASEIINGIRVASLHHLLILKLEASMSEDRENSEKGEKDKRDILQIIELNPGKINPLYLNPNRIKKLKQIVSETQQYIIIAKNNNHLASKIKRECEKNLEILLGRIKSKKKGFINAM